MRYLFLALTALVVLVFLTFVFPYSQTVAVGFMRSNITLPISSLAGLVFTMGIFAGISATLFVLSFKAAGLPGVRGPAAPTTGHGA